ncbi:Zn-dependent exopeptidase [Lentinula guzmanii]|uniref:Zn-dependent exopeptidase n=1 Tax=Lentinula guzmanii TaxID=2804957 RepID=A0AA38J757_9AGAR|nr:Zn-dependent exopeptidase [Lentinula guzmanii]
MSSSLILYFQLTESYDDLLPVGQDERWDIFKKFHAYLEESFPLMYEFLTAINTYVKPLLLTAHQDVVPVDLSNEGQWIHQPYSRYYDGTWIWGRGSVDDKADLIVQLITVNSLVEAGFQPQRTIVLAFGFDEESSGTEGAGKPAVYLEERYGKNAFAMLLDEGEGTIFALPGVSEKGYLDANIQIFTPERHSSIPPHHTSIGLLSLLIVSLEANPCNPRLTRNGTAFAAAQCAVAHSPEGRAGPTGDGSFTNSRKSCLKAIPFFDILSRTTQAVDLISGGVKSNALPEQAQAIINHRIAEYSSTSEIQNHITDLVLPFAVMHNLSVHAFGKDVDSDYQDSELGKIVLSEASSRYQADDAVVTPSLGSGTRSYWNLTQNIFRYFYREDKDDKYNGIHTINEGDIFYTICRSRTMTVIHLVSYPEESFIEQIRFFTRLLLNMDEVRSY